MNVNQSKRLCLNCDKQTTWQYNKNIGHSECQICGNRYSGKYSAQRVIEGRKSPIVFAKAWHFGYEPQPVTASLSTISKTKENKSEEQKDE